MGKRTVDGVTVTYNLAWNVSYNRVNPHRLTATCECGVQFISLACSDKVAIYLDTFIRESLRRHQTSGYCKLQGKGMTHA